MSDQRSLPEEVASEIAGAFVPGTGGVVARMFNSVRHEWDRNRSKALVAAERTSGLSREDLAERIEQHPELVPLVTRLLWEAAMSGQSPILEAMGAAFGAAIGQPERTTDYELILGGLRNLRGEDVHVLRHLRGRHVFHEGGENPEFVETNDAQSVRGLSERLSRADESIVFALIRLVNQGFATSASVLGGTRYSVSELGRLLFDALERMDGS